MAKESKAKGSKQAKEIHMEIIIGYFGIGLLALMLLDLFTGRLRSRLGEASHDTQMRLLCSGSFVRMWVARLLTIIALWLLWPVAIYGYCIGYNKGGKNEQKRKRA